MAEQIAKQVITWPVRKLALSVCELQPCPQNQSITNHHRCNDCYLIQPPFAVSTTTVYVTGTSDCCILDVFYSSNRRNNSLVRNAFSRPLHNSRPKTPITTIINGTTQTTAKTTGHHAAMTTATSPRPAVLSCHASSSTRRKKHMSDPTSTRDAYIVTQAAMNSCNGLGHAKSPVPGGIAHVRLPI